MHIIGQVFFVAGMLMWVGGWLWLVGVAFQEDALWGLGCVFLPFISLIFAIQFWSQAKKPFLISIGGSVLAIAGIMLIGHHLGDIH